MAPEYCCNEKRTISATKTNLNLMLEMKKQHHVIATVLALFITVCSFSQPSEVMGTGIVDLHYSKIAIGDINNNGNLDVIISGIDGSGTFVTKVYSNNADGTFIDLGANIIALVDGDIALADFNADNYLDIAICGRDALNNKICKIYSNDGDNTFTESSASLQGLYLGSLAWGDYDNDGDLDLLMCGHDGSDSNPRKTFIYENTGNGNFTEVMHNIPGVSRGQATWGDINNDGLLDIAISGLNNSNVRVTEIYTNNGDKTFSSHNANLQKLAFSNQHLIDYDNDGDLDFWISGNNGSSTDGDKIYLYKNTSGNFSLVSAGFTTLWDVAAAWSDYDADGDADLIYMGQDGSTPIVYYYRNDGSDVFTLVDLSIDGITEGEVAWLDYNNDLKQDIVISGSTSGGNKTRLYRNNISTANTEPSTPSALNETIKDYQATLTWTAGNDAETASNGLSYRICLGTSSGNYDIIPPMGDVVSGNSYLAEPGLIKGTSAVIKELTEGVYFWRVQTIDASSETSAFAAESSFAICDPVTLGTDQEICKNSLLELSAGVGTDVVNWYSENNGLIASNTKTIAYPITQNDKIRVEVIKSIGCTARDTVEVTALALPVFALPATDQVCYGETLSYEAGVQDETVKWFAQNGDLLKTGNNVDYQVTENEILKCEITGTNGCIDSAKIVISSLALPQASLGDDYGVCKGASVLLEISSMQMVNWYTLSGLQLAENQQQINISITGDTSIVAEFYNTDNCVNYDTLYMEISEITLVNAGNDTTICFNTSLVLGGNPTADGGTAPYIYTWTNENNLAFSSDENPEVLPTANTFYNLHVSDQGGCEGSDKITVIINPPTTINAGDDVELCYGNSARLGGNPTATGSNYSYTYRWWPETALSDPLDANPIATPLDTTTYRLIVSTYKCSSDTAFVTVNIQPLPQINISENINIGFGGTTTLEASGGVSYEWSPSDGLLNPYMAQTEASPETTTTYVVTVTDENECQSQAAVTVTVKNDLFIPSLFTPNGDGNNDFFKIYGTGIEAINMIIYNRNGNIVFLTSDVNLLLETGWDGTTNGAQQPQGSYMYVISGRFVDGTIITYNNNKGTINILR